MSIDLSNYQEFRSEAMTLKSNIGVMINKMDGIMNSPQFSTAAKAERIEKLMNLYL